MIRITDEIEFMFKKKEKLNKALHKAHLQAALLSATLGNKLVCLTVIFLF
jgi:hypothetical protein